MTETTARIGNARPPRFRRYPDYKASDADWLGEIPAHWDSKRLKFVAQTVAGQSPPSAAVVDGMDGLPFLQGNAEFGLLNPTPHQVCNSAPKRAESGDILISVRAPVGAMNMADQQYGIGRGLCAIRPTPELNRSFGFYQIIATRRLLDGVATGSTYSAVTASDVGDLLTLLPSEDEQRAIAGFLDRETAKIDALVAKKERLIELLQEKRAALITHAVTRGLDPNVPMKDSGVAWLGKIPAHWVTRQGRYLYRALSLPPEEGDGVVTAYRDGEVTLRSKRRAAGYTLAIQELGYQHVRIGDLVIQGMDAFAGAIGVCDSPGKCSPEYLVLAPLIGGTDNRYFAAALRLMAHRGYIVVVCNAVRERAPRFRTPEFRSVLLPRPPEAEQQSIAAFIENETGKIDILITTIRAAINHLNEYRTALISAAVTGKIDVRNEAA